MPPELVDQSARHALEVLKDVHDSLLVGVFVDGGCLLNPPTTPCCPRTPSCSSCATARRPHA